MPTHAGIQERKDAAGRTRWRVRVRRGGKLITATLPTQEDALAWRAKALSSADGIGDVPLARELVVETYASPTLTDAARRLVRGMVGGISRTRDGRPFKPSTIRKYEEQLRLLVLPRIGAVPVDALTRGDIQRLVDEIASEQTAEHARKALTALRVVLRDAIRYGDVEQNPCAGVCTPTSGEPERAARFLTPEEAASVLAAAQAEDERRRRSLAAPMIALAVGSGLRLGEQLSLPWGPTGLDLDAGVVRVRRNMDSVRDELGAYRFVSPKSRRGIRDVPLSPSDVALLRRHRLASGRPEDGDLVFSDELGRSLEPKNTARRILSRGCKKAGIAAPQPRWHDLRHSYASAQLAAGLSVHAVAHLIGDTPEMVWRRYGHALPDEVAGAGTALEEFRRSRGL